MYARCPQCARPAEITDRFSLTSTDGPLEHVKISCRSGHWFTQLAADVEAAHVARRPSRGKRRRHAGRLPDRISRRADYPPASGGLSRGRFGRPIGRDHDAGGRGLCLDEPESGEGSAVSEDRTELSSTMRGTARRAPYPADKPGEHLTSGQTRRGPHPADKPDRHLI